MIAPQGYGAGDDYHLHSRDAHDAIQTRVMAFRPAMQNSRLVT